MHRVNQFVLFAVIFLLRFDNLESKSVFVIRLACANLALKISAANLVTRVLTSGI